MSSSLGDWPSFQGLAGTWALVIPSEGMTTVCWAPDNSSFGALTHAWKAASILVMLLSKQIQQILRSSYLINLDCQIEGGALLLWLYSHSLQIQN